MKSRAYAGETVRDPSVGMKLIEERSANVPVVGEMAPDFELELMGGDGRVRLSQFRGHAPVALVFGSYT